MSDITKENEQEELIFNTELADKLIVAGNEYFNNLNSIVAAYTETIDVAEMTQQLFSMAASVALSQLIFAAKPYDLTKEQEQRFLDSFVDTLTMMWGTKK